MECNKDEAIRAKDIAVRKFTENDFSGAKKFALKSQSLYPGLEGISQMLTTIDVHISADSRFGGEPDYYGILGVNPLADDETIKKQYRKLALQIHPDKNQSIGADGAFLFVNEAFGVLSDKTQRAAYNTRRHVRMAQKLPVPSLKVPNDGPSQKVPNGGPSQKVPNGGPSQKVPNGGSSQKAPSGGSQPKVPTQSPAGVSGSKQKIPTQNSAGASGSKLKLPTQSSAGASGSKQKVRTQSPTGVNGTRHKEATQNPTGVNGSQQNVPAHSPTEVNGSQKNQASASARGKSQKGGTQKASSQVQSFLKKKDTFWAECASCKLKYEHMKINRDQMLKCPSCKDSFMAVEIPPPSAVAPLKRPKQARASSSSKSVSHVRGVNSLFSGGVGTRWSPLSGCTTYGSIVTSAPRAKPNSESQVSKVNLKRKLESDSALKGDKPTKKMRETNGNLARNYASGPSQPGTSMGNASQGYNVKVNVNRELSVRVAKKVVAGKALVDVRNKFNGWKLACDERAVAGEEAKKSRLGMSMQKPGSHKIDSNSHIGSQLKTITEVPEFIVPDPDFHVFDHDRLENCFKENQVWAAYDNDDGMPRFYALIHEVASSGSFKLMLSWLNSRSNTEFSTALDWVGRGFKKNCGDFWVGKHETDDLINSFSHQVKWEKGPRGVIQIYPRVGEIWALYQNWSPDWTLNTPDEVRHAYEMVEVVKDYKDETGVYVAPIFKAPGFRTVYYKQADPKVTKHIPKEEMFRFSHQVPHHILTGSEKPNAPKGFVELDPAATPAKLLHVTMVTDEEKSREHQ